MNASRPPSQPGRAPLRLPRVGRDEDHGAASGAPFDLFGVPVARVSEHDLGRVSDSGRNQLGLSRGDHRFELAEVG